MFSPDFNCACSCSVVSLALESQSFLFLQLVSSTTQLFLCSDCHGVRFNLFSSIPRLFPGIPVLPSISCGCLSDTTAVTDEIRRNVCCKYTMFALCLLFPVGFWRVLGPLPRNVQGRLDQPFGESRTIIEKLAGLQTNDLPLLTFHPVRHLPR
jgi:hypothetical protein